MNKDIICENNNIKQAGGKAGKGAEFLYTIETKLV
jgi:hypothetical protein